MCACMHVCACMNVYVHPYTHVCVCVVFLVADVLALMSGSLKLVAVPVVVVSILAGP